MADKTEILSVQPARGGERVTFRHVMDDGRIIGPLIEQRPKGANHSSFVTNRRSSDSAVPQRPDRKQELLEVVRQYTDAELTEALGLTPIQLAALRGGW